MKVMTKYEHGEDITSGKCYEVTEFDADVSISGGWINDDDGDAIYILITGTPMCCHLDCKGVWEIVEEEE